MSFCYVLNGGYGIDGGKSRFKVARPRSLPWQHRSSIAQVFSLCGQRHFFPRRAVGVKPGCVCLPHFSCTHMAAEFVYSLVTCTLNRDVHIHLLCEEHSSNDSFSVWHHIQLIKVRNKTHLIYLSVAV